MSASGAEKNSGPRGRLAIFDFDGTLADSFGWFAATLTEIAPRYRLNRLDESRLRALRGLDARAIMREIGLPAWKLPALTREMRRRMREDIDGIGAFPGVSAMLVELKAAGISIAVATSNDIENVRKVLGAESVALIDHFACGASLFGKAAKIRSVLRKHTCEASDALYFGDEIRDAQAAAAAGIAFVGVSWGYTSIDALLRVSPRGICRDMNDVVAIAAGRSIR